MLRPAGRQRRQIVYTDHIAIDRMMKRSPHVQVEPEQRGEAAFGQDREHAGERHDDARDLQRAPAARAGRSTRA